MKFPLRSYLKLVLLCLLLLLPQQVESAEIIGAIITGEMAYYKEIHSKVMANLSGFIDKEGIEVVTQKPTTDLMSIVNSARKLKTLGAKIIIAYGTTATLNSMKEVTDIPILFAGAYGTEKLKISGKNATGVSYTISIEKALISLQTLAQFSKLGVLFNKTEKDSILQARNIKKLEKKLNFKTILININQEANLDKINNCDALLYTTSCEGICKIDTSIALAKQKKIPTVSLIGGIEQQGVLLSFSKSTEEQSTQLTKMFKKIYNGTAPADIPIYKPDQEELIINKKEAAVIGITVQPNLLEWATMIIE